jgi:hypothetical protein
MQKSKGSHQEVIHQLNFLSNIVQPLGYDLVIGDRKEAAPKKNDAIAMVFGSVLAPCAAALKSEDKMLHIFCNSDVFNNSTKKNPSLSLYVQAVSKLLISKEIDLLKGLVFTLNVTGDGALVRKLSKVKEHEVLVGLCNPKKIFSNAIQLDEIYSTAESGFKLLNTYEISKDIDLEFIVKQVNLSFSLLESGIDVKEVNFFDQEKLIKFLADVVKDKSDFLQDNLIKSSFIVHAEILASILKFINKGNISDDIGISKLCCFLCKEYLDFNKETYTGEHNIYFEQTLKSLFSEEGYESFNQKLKTDVINQLSFFKTKQEPKDIKTIRSIMSLILNLDEQLDIRAQTFLNEFKNYKGLPSNKKNDFIKKYFPFLDTLEVTDEVILKIGYILTNISSFANNHSVLALKSNVEAINLILPNADSIKDYPNISCKQDYEFGELLSVIHFPELQQEEFKQSELTGVNTNI